MKHNHRPQLSSPLNPALAMVSDASQGLAVGTAGGELEYPEQRHAGAIGHGPEFQKGVGVDEKIGGLKDQLKGKITRDPELVEYGRERRTGELKRKEQEEDEPRFGRERDTGSVHGVHQHSTDRSKANTQNRAEYAADPHPAQPLDEAQSGTATYQNTNLVRNVAGSNEGAIQQAAFTAPEGSKEFELQAQKGSDQGMKYIG